MNEKINAMTKSEVALLYNPNVSPKSAVRTLNRWIEGNAALKTELVNAGYKRGKRIFTPKQIRIIYKYLDEP